MNLLKYVAVNVIESLLRIVPLRSRTGLVKIGNPNRHSPVLVTGNYHLTVARVKRAMQGLDAYLLVANSRGMNVWCAATGGHFTNHQVISVLKTSGIEELVAHRTVLLPQLAATGIETKIIRKRSGWRVVWGPVYAKDIPAFIENGRNKTPAMSKVEFPCTQRVEMAVAWAFPMSLIFALIAMPFWREAISPLIFLIWGLSFLIFLSFPVYRRWLSPGGRRLGFILFDFGRGGFQLIVWSILMVGLVAYAGLAADFDWGFVFRWGFISFIAVLLLSLDLMGSTPLYKSGLHEDRLLEVFLDLDKCKGAGFCEQVCPKYCFSVDRVRHVASRPRANECVQCGACIVQCPFDALYFKSPKGEIMKPETIRKFKLNLMGQRLVRTEG